MNNVSHVTLKKVPINLDGFNLRDTYFVDAIHGTQFGASTTSVSCGPNYQQELAIARDYAAKFGIPVFDGVAIAATVREQVEAIDVLRRSIADMEKETQGLKA